MGGSTPVKIVRVIARLNVGGPAIQAITLTKRLEERGYSTTLVRGQEDQREGSMDYLAEQIGVQPLLIHGLRRDPGVHDLRALAGLIRVLLRERPALVHTHAAKAGTLGRVAALLAGAVLRRRPVLVHTFHGHSLSGYFSPRTAAFYRFVERVLATRTDRLIAVSEEVRDDLVELGVAGPERFEVVPLGLNLQPFTVGAQVRARVREEVRTELNVAPDEVVVTLVARLVPIKRVDRFLRACVALEELRDVSFVVVGDGELGEELRRSSEARRLGERLIWTGMRRDVHRICFASDIVALSSDQEGTPVSLIEAAASGLPTVSTAVGGAGMVVAHGQTGLLVPADDGTGLADALRSLILDPSRRGQMGAMAQTRVLERFGLERLITDLDELYRRLLRNPAG